MKKMTAVAIAVLLFGWLSSVQAETTIRLGGGLFNNSARASGEMAYGVHGAIDFSLGESPWTVGIFGDGNFSESSGKPMLVGANVFYKMSAGGSHANGLDPRIYIGPSIGLASIDVGQQRESGLLLGGTAGVEFPLSQSMGLFGNAKYSWTNDKNGVELVKGFSAHVGVMFNLGN